MEAVGYPDDAWSHEGSQILHELLYIRPKLVRFRNWSCKERTLCINWLLQASHLCVSVANSWCSRWYTRMCAMVETMKSNFSSIKQITVDATDRSYHGLEKPLKIMKKACYNLIPWLCITDFPLFSISEAKLISMLFSSASVNGNDGRVCRKHEWFAHAYCRDSGLWMALFWFP